MASKGQKFSLPVVSHPHTVQRLTSFLRERNGSSGINRKRKKNGSPIAHKITVITTEPMNKSRLCIQGFMGFTSFFRINYCCKYLSLRNDAEFKI